MAQTKEGRKKDERFLYFSFDSADWSDSGCGRHPLWPGYVEQLVSAGSGSGRYYQFTTKKQVEDTCRAMIASYTSDKLVYEQYLTSSDLEKHGWAEQAKMRANKTAASYNEYILKNDYVWNGNIPPDIRGRLDYLE